MEGQQKKSFGICALELKEHIIHNIYHHKVNCSSNKDLYSEYLIIIAESERNNQLCMFVYEILPKSLSVKLED